MNLKELTIEETIEDLENKIDVLKNQLKFGNDEDFRFYIFSKINYYSNIINWLKEYNRICKKEGK